MEGLCPGTKGSGQRSEAFASGRSRPTVSGRTLLPDLFADLDSKGIVDDVEQPFTPGVDVAEGDAVVVKDREAVAGVRPAVDVWQVDGDPRVGRLYRQEGSRSSGEDMPPGRPALPGAASRPRSRGFSLIVDC